jgi:4-amino-4-deoxy-L-arabinose transferase-like glycosyltransferase
MTAALLAAAPLYSALAAYVIFDMMLALCVTVVWLGVASECADAGSAPQPRARILRRLAMFAAIAAGILIKGPVMLAWALGGSLAAALILRSLAPLRWLTWIPGWFVALGLPGAWFWVASTRFPEYPHYAILEESLERLTSNSFHRNQGWWFVPAVLVGGALPWSLVTPWSAGRLRRAAPNVQLTARVGLGFALFAALFFTLSHSQLVTYLLPALPPLAWYAAMMWSDGNPGRIRRAGLAAVLAFTPLLAAAAIARLRTMPAPTGAPLARSIAAAGGGRVRYEDCYSPGTDFLLGQTSTIVSRDGRETTSNYQSRYRATLALRGMWKVLGRPPDHDDARFVVRLAGFSAPPPAGATELHRDRVFTAYRIEPADTTARH